MGYSRKRIGRNGKARYTAYYFDIKGLEKSAGTFSNKKDADVAWQRAEAKVAEGRVGDPKRGRQSFERYVLDVWLPNHEMEATTRQKYTYSIHKHLIPEFGSLRMIDILPEHVRQWVATMKQNGVSPVTIKSNMVILSAVFTTALHDQVTYLHPCKGVKTPPVVAKPLTIINPEQFNTLYIALPDSDTRLLVETAIETGLRWGELTELRVRDLDVHSRILTVSRAVIDVDTAHRFDERGQHLGVDVCRLTGNVAAADPAADTAQRRNGNADRSCQPLHPVLPRTSDQLAPDHVPGGVHQRVGDQQVTQLRQRQTPTGKLVTKLPAVDGKAVRGKCHQLEDVLGGIQRRAVHAGRVERVGTHRVLQGEREFRFWSPV
ncbi:site-specific integrase [Streptosporangium sp. NPDC006007]|uniref:tyrosine-type recombinase/integrase n=1 Tax=Streptosporangium sp. NPDC006007 TaxID=3154575 RepID=UPI0033B85A0E